MIGLNEKAINELVRVTNQIAGMSGVAQEDEEQDSEILDFQDQPEEQMI
jgi:hypothetical protein